MATYYYPLKVVINGGTSVYSSASQKTRFKILISTGTTESAARNGITGATSVYAYTVGNYGDNLFWVTRNTSGSIYMAVGVINPYSHYITTTGKTVTQATSVTDTPYAFTVQMQAFSTLTSKNRLVTQNMLDYMDTYSDNPLGLRSGAYSAMDVTSPSSEQNNYVTCFHVADYMSYCQITDRDDDSYAPWDKLAFEEGSNTHNVSRNFVVVTNDLYWSGTSITVYNQSVSSSLTLSSFDVSATTTSNITVSIFHLASSQLIGAGVYKTVTVTHAALNPVVAASSVTLTLSCSGPAVWNGPVSVKDSKNLFNETANAKTLTSTKYITASTSGGTISVYMRPPTIAITAGTGLNLRATNTTSMNIVLMYLEIWAEDVTNGYSYQEMIGVTGNPTIAAGASNVVLGKTVSKTSYSGQHLRITIQGYTTYAPNTISIQASGSTGQNFGVHSISGVDPANFDEVIEWDASGNVVLTGGTITIKFS